MKRITQVIAVGAVIAATFSAFPALGQEEGENKGFMAAMGRVTFQRYCASCHGEKADGTGPVARMLKIPPTNLRMLSAENDGEFPTDRVTAAVDGRNEVKTHGSRDMPVWGEVFQTPLVASSSVPDEDREDRALRKVREIVLYVETIQEVPAEAETDSAPE